ncbi:GIY-YIG nuclease family protein [Shewanella maritima]|uniref:GIY-YIG nuclease family protein n=1 Tax=Shewanella maritima TaxID=2520507 RepID=UPI0037362DB3
MPQIEQCQPWFLYVIQCANGHLYTGVTTDVARRFKEHQSGKKGAKFLQGKGPLTLVYQESQTNRSEAQKREAAVKKLPRVKKLAMINSQQNQLLQK